MKQRNTDWQKEMKNVGSAAVGGVWKFFQVIMNILITVLLIAALTGIIVATAFTVYIKNYVNTEIDVSDFTFSSGEGTTTTEMYYYDFTDRTNRIGTAKLLDGENIVGDSESTYVSFENIPDNMINAIIAIEDKRFYTHNGVDFKRTIGAALEFFIGGDSYGGSTITQQLVKNITGDDDYSIQRKVQEIFYAFDLETKMDKEQILELYLNVVNFGGNYYGVQAAAKNYFNKDVSELTLIECAAIAGITQNPSKYNPKIYPENNAERRDLVLSEMYSQGLITQREYEDAYGHELVLNVPTSDETLSEQQQNGINSWYTDMVINDIISDLVEEKGMTRRVASMLVYNGGLKIYSLVDPDIQAQVEAVYQDDSNFSVSSAQSACIVIDPYTGDILAVCGARGVKNANRIQNFATDVSRPTGSAIKPLSVYAPMIDQKLITWATVTDDTPYNFEENETGWPRNDEKWEGNSYRGLVTTQFAVTYSLNTVAVKLLDKFGIDNSFDFCYNKLGLTDLLDSYTSESGKVYTDRTLASLALGQETYGISLRQLAAAYSIFPNRGIFSESNSYNLVTYSDGTVLLEKTVNGNAVISEETACVMNHLLETVVESGTASTKFIGAAAGSTLASTTGISVAGKTGSAQNNYDRWFIGYTPYYICGVWTGSEYNNVSITEANPSVKVFDSIMIPIHAGLPIKEFTESDNVGKYTYCKDSGMLYDADLCGLDPRGSRLEEGYFIKGTEPTSKCTTHVLVDYDVINGGVSDSNCPSSYTKTVALVRVNRDFNCESDITILDAEYAYMDVGDLGYYSLDNEHPFYYSLSSVTEDTGKVDEDGNPILIYHKTGYTLAKRTGTNGYKVTGTVKKQYNSYCVSHYVAPLPVITEETTEETNVASTGRNGVSFLGRVTYLSDKLLILNNMLNN